MKPIRIIFLYWKWEDILTNLSFQTTCKSLSMWIKLICDSWMKIIFQNHNYFRCYYFYIMPKYNHMWFLLVNYLIWKNELCKCPIGQELLRTQWSSVQKLILRSVCEKFKIKRMQFLDERQIHVLALNKPCKYIKTYLKLPSLNRSWFGTVSFCYKVFFCQQELLEC